jgi:hypothetical protein
MLHQVHHDCAEVTRHQIFQNCETLTTVRLKIIRVTDTVVVILILILILNDILILVD